MIWVAEIGSMHKGSPALAYEMIRQFAASGATICKFQFGWTKEAQEAMGLEYKPERYVDGWANELARWCDNYSTELMASIWSEEGLETARWAGLRRYKISSQVWKHNKDLAELILKDGLPTYVSGEVYRKDAYPIYCVSKYPTYPREINMPQMFTTVINHYHGYSDHAHGIEACLLAVSRGAKYIEKHVCLDKTDLTVRDTAFSATPEEFAQMVRLGNGIRRLIDAGD